MIANLNSTQIAKGIDNVLSAYVISPPTGDYPLQACGRKVPLTSMHNMSSTLRIIEIQKIKITNEHLSPIDSSINSSGYRPAPYSVGSVEMAQTLHPLTIDISVELINQSNLAHVLIAKRILRVYAQDLKELKLGELLMRAASVYECKFGKNSKTPTEISWLDLTNISSLLASRGAVAVFSQYLSTTQIGTSAVPKAFMLLSTPQSMRTILHDLDVINTRSYISSNNYAGAQNFANNVYGVEVSSRMAFISSNNLNEISENSAYRCLILAGDSWLIGKDTPSSSMLATRDSLVVSPVALTTQVSTRCPYSAAISRIDSIFQLYASNKV